MILLADAVWRRKSRIIIFIMFRPLESNWRSERRVRWFYRFVSMKVFPGLLHILSIWGMLNSNTLQLNFDKQSLSFSDTNIKPAFSSMATRDHHSSSACLIWQTLTPDAFLTELWKGFDLTAGNNAVPFYLLKFSACLVLKSRAHHITPNLTHLTWCNTSSL